MSWQKPSKKPCPRCGGVMVERGKRLVCADTACGYFEENGKEEE
jgi:DNA topoisomerase-1